MPFPVDAETTQVYEEGRGALASVISNLLGILRQFIAWATGMFRQIISYVAEHPEGTIQLVGNFCIWMA